ncbi:transcriptional regulators LysR family [Vibrio variabilis]|uniref:Transcriptional regulators LysR family n=1 Tax=Vibrio variabilis TaxID=990271 RepID=A0ABQ0J8Y6_9VIBR|nr:transcriptional regulators LysR family [Vibrio variabilis]
MFTREQIMSFCAVFEHGSYSAAARALGRDRSTVREHVTILEDNIGVDLFSIQGRSAVPTNTAKKLYPRGVSVARQIEEFEKAAFNSFEQELLTLNVYHDAMIPSPLIAYMECALSEEFSQLQVNWLHRSRQQAMEDLLKEKAHLALMPIKMNVQPDREVNYLNLGRVPVSVYTGTESLIGNKTAVRLADLQLTRQYILENHYDAALQGVQISPSYSIVSNNDVVIELLKNNGWALLPDELATPFCQRGDIQKVDSYEVVNTINYNICTFYSPSLEHNPIVQFSLDVLRRYAREYLD